jgi:hypothetical protein
MVVCAVRSMRAVLHATTPSKLIWGMSGSDNSVVSKSAWANRIQMLSNLHLGSPRTGICHLSHLVATQLVHVLLAQACC